MIIREDIASGVEAEEVLQIQEQRHNTDQLVRYPKVGEPHWSREGSDEYFALHED